MTDTPREQADLFGPPPVLTDLTLLSVGYRSRDPFSLTSQAKERGARVLIDLRYHPWVRNPEYRPDTFRRACTDADMEYIHLRGLGNVNYRTGGEIKLYDPLEIHRLEELLTDHKTVAVMCVCSSYPTCHVRDVVELLRQGLEFNHYRLQRAGGSKEI